MQGPEAPKSPEHAVQELSRPPSGLENVPIAADGAAGPCVKSSAALSAGRDAHRRSGRTRTVRVRDGFFDSSLLHYVALEDKAAGSVSDDAVAKRGSPLPVRPPCSKLYQGLSLEEDDRPVGPEFQALIPAMRPRPAKPTAAEAKFLPQAPLYDPVDPSAVAAQQLSSSKTRAGRAGVTMPMPPVGVAASSSDFRYKYRWAKDGAGRRKLLHAAVNALDKQLGPSMVKVLGLESVGFKFSQAWQPHEELLFCLGMCDKYRMFKYIRQCYLWSRSAHELNGYYHNVWKTRSTELADEFLTLRDGEGTKEEFSAFVDKVRDQLTAMWDKKKMGDMPKLLKDMAAAAAATKAAPAKERNKQAELLSSSEDDEGAASDSSTETADDSDNSRRAARNKQKQKKRPQAVAGVAPPPVSKVAKKARPASNGTSHVQDTPALAQQQQPKQQQQQQKQAQQQQQKQQRPQSVPTSAGQQYVNPSQLVQRPRSGVLRTTPTSTQAVPNTLAKLQLPDMPRLQRPDVRSQAAVATWLKAIPNFKAELTSYVETVDTMTDTAIERCQAYISQLQEQRATAKERAEAYLKTLLAQGQNLVAAMTAQQHKEQQDTQQQQPQQPPQQQQQQQKPSPKPAVVKAEAPPALELPSASQQPRHGDEKAAAGAVQGTDIDRTCKHGSEAADTLTEEQQQQQSPEDTGSFPDAVSTLRAGHEVGSMASHQQQQQQQRQPPCQHAEELEVASDSRGRQPDQQDVAPTVDAPSPLPFPGGPLSKWLNPRMQPPGSMDSSGLKHIPRPYLKRPKLETSTGQDSSS